MSSLPAHQTPRTAGASPAPQGPRRLQEARGPALVVAPVSGRVIASNPQAAGLLGLAPLAGTVLDAAMPGLSRLRGLLATSRNGYHTRERLVLWTRGGTLALDCEVSLLQVAAGEEPTVLVVALDQACPAGGRAPDEGVIETARDAPSDDASVLRQIALRIRALDAERRERMGEDVIQVERAHAKGPMSDQDQASSAGEKVQEASADPGQTAVPVPPELMARLAHELKTPLSAIAAASEIMRDERFGPIGDARYRGYAADIHMSARHALELIQRMLAAREPDSAATQLEFVEVDLDQLLTSAVSPLRPLAESARLTLDVALAPRLPRVIADATSLRQILLNLLTNALKFTPAGGAIEVTTRHEPQGSVTICVSDNGPGLAPEATRAGGGGRPRPHGGLGIGLPLAHSLAAANGAALEIASEVGRGTRATLTFPRSRVVPV